MAIILGANSAADTGYDVANSCRFFDDTALHKDNAASATDRDKYTFSFWYKKCSNGVNHKILMVSGSGTQGDGSGNYMTLYFTTDDTLRWQEYGDSSDELITTQVFRDPSAWYHFVLRFDSTNGTADDRMRIYVNGTQVTAFGTRINPDQNEDGWFADDDGGIAIGGTSADDNFCNGYLAEIVGVDGQSLAPTDFGEFDEDSPTIWKPKKVSGLTFGTNGFYLDFEASDNLGNDANGGTDFTEVNLAAVDQCTDSPTNNFATLNPLWTPTTSGTEEANLTLSDPAAGWSWKPATIMPSAGKWYAEFKPGHGSDPIYTVFGVVPYASFPYIEDETIGAGSSSEAESVGYDKGGNVIKGNATQYSGTSYGYNDIVCVAVDLDNRKIYFRKNDAAWENSGDPTSGATGTGAVSLSTTLSDWSICPSATQKAHCNYGGGCAFSISSGNADGDGYGNFEYAVPSGYYALNSKNLGAYGG